MIIMWSYFSIYVFLNSHATGPARYMAESMERTCGVVSSLRCLAISIRPKRCPAFLEVGQACPQFFDGYSRTIYLTLAVCHVCSQFINIDGFDFLVSI